MKIFIDKLLIPVNPESIKIESNSKVETISILKNGDLPISTGMELKKIEFESFIPGAKFDGNYMRNSNVTPKEFIDKIQYLQRTNTAIQFLIGGAIGAILNSKFLIQSFSVSTAQGYEDDVIYSIALIEYKEHAPIEVSVTSKNSLIAAENSKRDALKKENNRPKPTPPRKKSTSKPIQRTHTVVRGDCLWKIAQKYYGKGAMWRKIYNANKSKIKDPHWIYPGQVFIIP